MSEFISVVKFFFGVCMSLLIMAAGVHFTYMYYMTTGPVHDVFAVVGPLFIAFSFCTAFLVVYELTQELRSEAHTFEEYQDLCEARTFEEYQDLIYAAYEERLDYVINSALEEKK